MRYFEGKANLKSGAIPDSNNGKTANNNNILASIAKYPYLLAKISPCCVEHPRQATACLAVFSLPAEISARNFVYQRFEN